jgi:hypothetical protein
MIDDYEITMELIEEMKAHLPIPVYAGSPFIRMMREKGIRIKSRQRLQIEEVFYAGDDGGIMCALGGFGEEEAVYVVSLTHIKMKERHPLTKAVKAYQRTRRKALAGQAAIEQIHSLLNHRHTKKSDE